MLFARVVLPGHESSRFAKLLRRANLDLLQVDVGSTGGHPQETVGKAQSPLSTALADVVPSLYLHPELRVVTNASSGSTLETISSVAQALVSAGSSDLLITAIRGDSVLNDLEAILPPALIPAVSKISSARVEIGGGPFAAAFAERSRFIVAGTYDISAPLLGAAVAEGILTWRDYGDLGRLAATSHFAEVVVEIGPRDAIELESTAMEQLSGVRSLSLVQHADVRVDLSDLVLEATVHNSLSPSRVRSEPAESMWNVRISVDSGFSAVALVECSFDRIVRLFEPLPREFAGSSVECTEYRGAACQLGDPSLARIECRSDSEEACLSFLVWLQSTVEAGRVIGRLVAPRPTVERLAEMISVQVPADAVTIAVDTRPAREWL